MTINKIFGVKLNDFKEAFEKVRKMLLAVLKIIAVAFIILFVIGGIRRIADNFRSWRYERKHRALFESCRKEQERKF